MFSHFTIFLLLLSFWLLLSGHTNVLLVTLGILSAAGVTLLCRHLGIIGTGLHTLRFYLRLPLYLFWLSGLIIVANTKVALAILRPRLRIQPDFIRVPMSQQTDLGRLVHANSITLTPGTVSVDMDADTIEVHTLWQSDDDTHLQIDRRVSRLETGN